MNALEELADEQIIAAAQLDQSFAYTSISLLNMIEEGFAATGGIAQTFVEGMTGLAVNFFKDAQQYEAEIISADARVISSRTGEVEDTGHETDTLSGEAGGGL